MDWKVLMQSEQMKQLVVDALEDLKGVDIVALDVRNKTSFTDFMVIASGRSDRQVKSLAQNVVTKARERGLVPRGRMGGGRFGRSGGPRLHPGKARLLQPGKALGRRSAGGGSRRSSISATRQTR
jgi:hypothetical protein